MAINQKKQKIKIIELDGNNIAQKYDIDSVSDFSSLDKELKKNIKESYDLLILKNKEFKKVNKDIFKINSKENKELYLVKKDNLNHSENSEIYDKLNISIQQNLDEKTICSICLTKMKEKPYYCYKCHKLYCDDCFQKLQIIKKKKCGICRTENVSGQEICENCHKNHEIEYARCYQCYFLMDKNKWQRLINYSLDDEYNKIKIIQDKEKLINIYEDKYREIKQRYPNKNKLIFNSKKNFFKKNKLWLIWILITSILAVLFLALFLYSIINNKNKENKNNKINVVYNNDIYNDNNDNNNYDNNDYDNNNDNNNYDNNNNDNNDNNNDNNNNDNNDYNNNDNNDYNNNENDNKDINEQKNDDNNNDINEDNYNNNDNVNNSTEEESEKPKEIVIIPENHIKDEPFILTEKHRTRISLLQECMKAYGVEDYPILKDENYTEKYLSNDKILSISTLEMDFNKGKSLKIFKTGFELEEGEYACISYKSKDINQMIKIDKGIFSVPDDFNEDINETPFTFILYFNYDPSINDFETLRELENMNNEKSLDLYNKETISNNKLLIRKLNIFSEVKNIFQNNSKTVVKKVTEKTVSYVCVSLVEYLFQEFNNDIIKGISQYACDELGEFPRDNNTILIFKPNSKPDDNYKEIVYEESKENDYNTYAINIFSIPYLKNSLEKIKDQNYLEVKDDYYNKYASIIIPPENLLTKHNHIFNPLGNLILAELSSAYLKPILLNDKFSFDKHFFKQYKFEWTYTDKCVKEDNTNLNSFLEDNKYILFNNLDCINSNKLNNSSYEFYIAIKKLGTSKIEIYKNPKYIYLEKYSDFKAAIWIKNIEDINTCFHFNNLHNKFDNLHFIGDDIQQMLQHYVYAYKKINLAEYNISKFDKFDDFITFTSVEKIIMPFYSNENDYMIERFISNNYRLKYIDWNEFSIKSSYIDEFITYSRLEGIDLNLKFLKGASDVKRLFLFDDITNINISNFDTSQVTSFYDIFGKTMGNNTNFLKEWNTSNLISVNRLISNEDIIKIDLSSWNKNNIKNMKYILSDCPSLQFADLAGHISIKNIYNFDGLFLGSKSIKEINTYGWSYSNINFTTTAESNASNIFDESVLSKVKIYISGISQLLDLNNIKKFFHIDNENQFTTKCWTYEGKIVVRTGTILATCKYAIIME